jgi:hypothetical protein
MVDTDLWGPPVAPPSPPAVPPQNDSLWGPAISTAQAEPAPDPNWGPPVKPPEQPESPMPGVLEATYQGIGAGLTGLKQTGQAVSGSTPDANQPTSPAADPLAWKDVAEPWGRLAPKLGYMLGSAAPSMATGMAGAGLGTAAAGPAGGLVGGATGMAIGAAAQTLGPVFAEELRKDPHDPNGAWERAMHEAEISGAFSGAAWAAFPLKAFEAPLKNLVFQALGVQAPISVAEQATRNMVQGKPVTDNLQQAYAQGSVGTIVPALAHGLIAGGLGGPRADTSGRELTPPQQAAQAKLQAANQQAETLEQQAHAMVLPDQSTPQGQAAAKSIVDQRNDLFKQANDIRDAALHESWLANLPPDVTAKGAVAKSWTQNFMPELTSDKALQIDPIFAKFKSGVAQMRDAIISRAEDSYYRWNKVPAEDATRFMTSYEEGKLPQDLTDKYPWMQERAEAYKKYLDIANRNEAAAGSPYDFITNYFPHIWKDPVVARDVFKNYADTSPEVMGSNWFSKGRYYDLIQKGLDRGLELKSSNPEELVTMRLMSSADMVNKTNLLRELYSQGVAVPKDNAPGPIMNPMRNDPHPWQEIVAPNGKSWMIAPDAQPMWENAVVAKGLWANDGLPGTLFQKWMSLKNAWVPIKLGLSLFHPIHVMGISLSNNLSRAWNEAVGRGEQSIGRRLGAIPEALMQSITDTALALPIGTPFVGKTWKEAWKTPGDDQNNLQKGITKIANEAGMSLQLSEQMRIRAKRDFSDAWNNNQYLKSVLPGMRLGVEKLTGWIFEQWIPNLKAAALARESAALFRRRPDLLDDQANRQVALRAIGRQIDNRFGEMFYGSLFWNRTLKDAAIGSFLSLGWNLGFAREFVGGALEPAARRLMSAPTPTRQLIRDTTTKSTNLFFYAMTSMIANALLNKAFSDDWPQEAMDYIFPRMGGLNTDGSPRRMSNPFYTREIPMVEKNIEDQQSPLYGLLQTAYHKMMYAPVAEMLANRDYFGYQIYDENAPWFKRAYQMGKSILNEDLNPMSIVGARRSLQLSGKPYGPTDIMKQITDPDVYMPMLGFGPAPAYASRSNIENHIVNLYSRHVAPVEKPFAESENAQQRADARTEYLGAMQRKDTAATSAAAKKLADLGVKSATIRKLQPGGGMVYMFSRLPASDQINTLENMQPADFKKYYAKASKNTRDDQTIRALAQKYYGIQ